MIDAVAAHSAWYVVRTQPRAETKASLHLRRQGFEVYLPRFLKRRRHARRVEAVPAPLFPQYLFVRPNETAQRWRSIRSTLGVSNLVCQGDGPAPLSGAVVKGLRDREDESGFVALDLRPAFAAGDAVRIMDGAFSTCLGLIEGMADSQRVAVLMDLLGRKVRVVLDAESVVAA